MTEIVLNDLVATVAIFTSPIYAILIWHSKRLVDLCEFKRETSVRHDYEHGENADSRGT